MSFVALGILAVGAAIIVTLDLLGMWPGGMRTEALERFFIGLLWFAIATPLFLIWFAIGFLLMVFDVLWQLVFGSEGIMPMNVHERAYDWYTKNVDWVLYGGDEFDPLPYV